MWSKARFKFQVAKPGERASDGSPDTLPAPTTLSHTTLSILPGPCLQIMLSLLVVSEHKHMPKKSSNPPVRLNSLVGK